MLDVLWGYSKLEYFIIYILYMDYVNILNNNIKDVLWYKEYLYIDIIFSIFRIYWNI